MDVMLILISIEEIYILFFSFLFFFLNSIFFLNIIIWTDYIIGKVFIPKIYQAMLPTEVDKIILDLKTHFPLGNKK